MNTKNKKDLTEQIPLDSSQIHALVRSLQDQYQWTEDVCRAALSDWAQQEAGNSGIFKACGADFKNPRDVARVLTTYRHERVAVALAVLDRLSKARPMKLCSTPVWVLHSPYPDGTWRGIEKCQSTEQCGAVLYPTKEAAQEALRGQDDMEQYFRVVEVTLVTPFVRKPLDEAREEVVYGRLQCR